MVLYKQLRDTPKQTEKEVLNMKKVSATVIYRDNIIYNLTVNHKGNLTQLVTNDSANSNSSFQDMYKRVLKILKNNNLYCGYYDMFNRRWYDIQFINLDRPFTIDKIGYAL